MTGMRKIACLGALIFTGWSGTAVSQDTPKEIVEADVSTRTLSITSGYSGAEILIFGAVENSRQPSPEAGTYDIVVVVEGTPKPTVVRKKSRAGGIWINTQSQRFASMPSYYAIATTRPLDEIADSPLLDRLEIGFAHVRMAPISLTRASGLNQQEIDAYKEAVVRLKQKENLYKLSEYGVTFVGRSVFRSTIALPPHVPIGPLTARVYLFREGQLLSQFKSRVTMEREGIEKYLHYAALRHPVLYGISAVLIAAAFGFAASTAFRRKGT